jgi:glycosyltransferase involved in cell wall biosynthesis
MPCFDVEAAFIKEAVASLRVEREHIGALGGELRLYIVDDGSQNPSTRLAVDRASDSFDWVTVKRLPKNRGPSAARNCGIEQATAPLIAFLDADDYLIERGLARLYKEMVSDASIQWISGDFFMQLGDAKPSRESNYLNHPSRRPYVIGAFEKNSPIRLTTPVAQFLDVNLCSIGSCIISRKLILGVGGFDINLRKGVDTELYWRLARATDLVFAPWPVLVYRRRAGSITLDGRPLPEWEPAVLKRMLKDEEWRAYSVEIKRRLLRTRLNLTAMYATSGQRTQAIAFAREAIMQKPWHPRVWAEACRALARKP